jgi:hypothetical protein
MGGKDEDGIDSDESDDNSNYENKPGDYPTPLSIEEQANNEVLLDLSPTAIPDLSSEFKPASTEPSSTFFKVSQPLERRLRARRALISLE